VQNNLYFTIAPSVSAFSVPGQQHLLFRTYFSISMPLSLRGEMKGEAQALHKERHLRKEPTVPSLRNYSPTERDLLHPQKV
jgi:hypothetical protein